MSANPYRTGKAGPWAYAGSAADDKRLGSNDHEMQRALIPPVAA
jgi:hypothetical protein